MWEDRNSLVRLRGTRYFKLFQNIVKWLKKSGGFRKFSHDEKSSLSLYIAINEKHAVLSWYVFANLWCIIVLFIHTQSLIYRKNVLPFHLDPAKRIVALKEPCS